MARKINVNRELIEGFFISFYEISDRSRTLDRRMNSGKRYFPAELEKLYYQCVRAETVLEDIRIYVPFDKRMELECWKNFWKGKCEVLGMNVKPENALRF